MLILKITIWSSLSHFLRMLYSYCVPQIFIYAQNTRPDIKSGSSEITLCITATSIICGMTYYINRKSEKFSYFIDQKFINMNLSLSNFDQQKAFTIFPNVFRIILALRDLPTIQIHFLLARFSSEYTTRIKPLANFWPSFCVSLLSPNLLVLKY